MLVLVAGSTRTARIEGISAAGAAPSLLAHTPGADLEIVTYGKVVWGSVVPVSPSGCPTPAVVTRAARELQGCQVVAVDAGMAGPTAAPTLELARQPGRDVREVRAVPEAEAIFETARSFGESLPDRRVWIGETTPGGTTTALGVLSALGERAAVSSSMADNPLALKERVVEEGLAASDLGPGGAAGDPVAALEAVGDPVLAVVAGLLAGARTTGTPVTLAGGTQLAAAAALARHAGVEGSVSLATTVFVDEDPSASIRELAADLDLSLTVTDPEFDRAGDPALSAYPDGEAKEGVGMGGMLARVDDSGLSMAALRKQVSAVTDRLETDRE